MVNISFSVDNAKIILVFREGKARLRKGLTVKNISQSRAGMGLRTASTTVRPGISTRKFAWRGRGDMTFDEANTRGCLNCSGTFNITDPTKSVPENKLFCNGHCRNAYRARRKNNGIKFIKVNYPDIYRKAFACD